MAKCTCDMRTKLAGDGCEVCNPALALEYAKETIEELSARVARLEGAHGLVLLELGETRNALVAAKLRREAAEATSAALKEALRKIADGRGMIPDKSTIYMNGKVPEIPKCFNKYDMQEIASRALEEK